MKKFCKDCRWFKEYKKTMNVECNIIVDCIYGLSRQYKEEEMRERNKNFDCPDYEEKEE